MTRKTFVVDTNVLLYDPESILKFKDNDVVVPITVLEELDSLKRLHNELGKNARTAVRLFDSLKTLGSGDLHSGVRFANGTAIRIQLEIKTDYAESFTLSSNDNRIIMAAYFLQEKGEKVVFVSKDFAARVKAEAVGIEAQDYENLKTNFEKIYRGMRSFEISQEELDLFSKEGGTCLKDDSLISNEYCILTSQENKPTVGKFRAETGKVEPLVKGMQNLWGVNPLNVEQKCALDCLLREDIKLVSLVGAAGTGKTLLALAAALNQVFDKGRYTRILVSRPIIPLGKDIGYLPGTKEEKLYIWMQPIYDNLEFLCDSQGKEPSETLRWVLESKKIEMEAVTYIRGRTLPKMFMIIDEAQNLTPHEVKTVISRAGEGTKVVLTGDPTQIDNPYLDKNSNGLTYTIERFKNQKLFGHVVLEKTERSELAAMAAKIL